MRKALLSALLIAAAFLIVVESGRLQMEKSLGHLLQSRIRIGRLSVSTHRLTLHRVSIQPLTADLSGKNTALLVIERLQIQGSPLRFFQQQEWLKSVSVTGLTVSFAGVPLQAEGRVFLNVAPDASVRCEGWLTLQHPLLKGQIEVTGPVRQPVLLGWLEGPRVGRKHFVSQLVLSLGEVELSRMELQGGWFARGSLRREEMKVRGLLNVAGPEGRYELRAESLPSGGGQALFWMQLEDQIPMELTANWLAHRSNLDFQAGLNGEQVGLNGRVALRPPYPVDLSLDFKGTRMVDMARWLLPPGKIPRLEGRLEGQVRLSGPLNRIISRGEVYSRNGKFGRESFTLAALRFQGVGPVLHVQNSQFAQAGGGILLVEGAVDLRRLGQKNFFSEMRLASVDKSLTWDGWRMTPHGSSGLQMQKGEQDRMEVGLNFELDQSVQTEPVTRQEIELQYPVSSDQSLSMRMDRDGEFLGLERRKKF